MIADFNHEILHVLGQFFALRAIHFFTHLSMHIILMPVPGNIGTVLSEFLPGVLGNRAAKADQGIENSAGRAIQDTTVRSLAIDDPLPLFYRCLHDADFIHSGPLSLETVRRIGNNRCFMFG